MLKINVVSTWTLGGISFKLNESVTNTELDIVGSGRDALESLIRLSKPPQDGQKFKLTISNRNFKSAQFVAQTIDKEGRGNFDFVVYKIEGKDIKFNLCNGGLRKVFGFSPKNIYMQIEM